MTDTATRADHDTRRTGDSARHKDGLRPPEDRGTTTIADSVVEKMAGIATREVPGVHNLGAGMARTIGGVRERMPGTQPSITRGVHVEVGTEQAAVDLDVVIDYGYSIADVVSDVRVNVISALERMTGLEVVEVNVAVDDIEIDDDSGGDGGRDDRESGRRRVA
ncbi:Asp23/Gls24 family envelope stress response protein [Actinacidiphila acidipaludis]|uniref:Asp23/Gls24 family envelope stress response protein n=1 Tax=Actinacidiphila acidipaludis TaxID=2873382 RepID=A0ABS7Q287_9ACTN|nr:Asp23/Gls24 family envelope stress response protein [Streptomyces acidipaludis]MBY8877240.1 Asp23/Gls24 family envelope stress response protein [Streptomyces acidipaludis]